jgi:hypothetical protein
MRLLTIFMADTRCTVELEFAGTRYVTGLPEPTFQSLVSTCRERVVFSRPAWLEELEPVPLVIKSVSKHGVISSKAISKDAEVAKALKATAKFHVELGMCRWVFRTQTPNAHACCRGLQA